MLGDWEQSADQRDTTGWHRLLGRVKWSGVSEGKILRAWFHLQGIEIDTDAWD